MCPLYPFHFVLLYLCLLLPLLLAVVECSDVLIDFKRWNIVFSPQKIEALLEQNSTEVEVRKATFCLFCVSDKKLKAKKDDVCQTLVFNGLEAKRFFPFPEELKQFGNFYQQDFKSLFLFLREIIFRVFVILLF